MSADPDILAWRGELAMIGFEGCFSQIRGAVHFIKLGEFQYAVAAVERAMPFWKSALDEMREIRAALAEAKFNGQCAGEYRAERDQAPKIKGAA